MIFRSCSREVYIIILITTLTIKIFFFFTCFIHIDINFIYSIDFIHSILIEILNELIYILIYHHSIEEIITFDIVTIIIIITIIKINFIIIFPTMK